VLIAIVVEIQESLFHAQGQTADSLIARMTRVWAARGNSAKPALSPLHCVQGKL
jgi:hypothetical protein